MMVNGKDGGRRCILVGKPSYYTSKQLLTFHFSLMLEATPKVTFKGTEMIPSFMVD